jgi:hypothetical protein
VKSNEIQMERDVGLEGTIDHNKSNEERQFVRRIGINVNRRQRQQPFDWMVLHVTLLSRAIYFSRLVATRDLSNPVKELPLHYSPLVPV